MIIIANIKFIIFDYQALFSFKKLIKILLLKYKILHKV